MDGDEERRHLKDQINGKSGRRRDERNVRAGHCRLPKK